MTQKYKRKTQKIKKTNMFPLSFPLKKRQKYTMRKLNKKHTDK